jgi:hypothetical protein
VDLLGHLLLEGGIDKALALQPALALKSGCDDLHPEMCFTAGARTRMPGMAMGFVDNLKTNRVEF